MREAFSVTPVWVLFLCLTSGIFVGLFYFLHLWKSLQNLKGKSRKRLFGGSLIRLGIFVGALLLVSAHNPARLVMFFVGFMIVRTIGLYTFRKQFLKEKTHA